MTVKFGIIGCGSICRHRHAPELAANPQAEILAFCDIVPERADAMVELYGGKAYTDWKDVVADPKIDAIVVCLPNYLHAPVTIAALKAGKHVLCEKPMATSAEEAEEMIQAAKDSGKYLMIGHNQRLMPPHVKAKEILDSGKLGKVLTFRTTFGHAGPEGWCVDKSVKTWFFQKDKAFIGAMGDLGVHKADLIRWLLGEEVVEVGAFVGTLDKRYEDGSLINVDDNATCILRTESGIIGTLIASWTYRGGEDNGTILYCENGVMKIGYDPNFQVTVTYRDGTEECYNVGAIATNERQVTSGVSEAFVNSIVNEKAPEISGEEGYEALKIILACLKSTESKQIAKV
ncbi:MAG: Gfo/Idh/MocA family oxidoreductase [Firmicutes bacterium]|nr:Gfo/Idh/MocA family oxidoreductase [Bacillota bacterium]